MAVPKSKVTRSRRGMRRSHDSLDSPSIREDEDGRLHRPHHVNLKTGRYRGKQVFEPKSDV